MKHILWLIKELLICMFSVDYEGFAECKALIKLHLTKRRTKIR